MLRLTALILAAALASSGGKTNDDTIDLSAYELTFEDDFSKLDASGRRCDSRWIAHTPWNGDFGSAVFVDPSRGFPFSTKNGILRIEAKKVPEQGWLSGLLSARNTCGEGFAQKFGYFEIRTKLPQGDGFWPAFWLVGIDHTRFTAEVDIFEHHGLRPDQFEATVHVFPYKDGIKEDNRSFTHRVPAGLLMSEFNTYGVSIEDDEMVFYFNRKAIWRAKTHDEYKQPMHVLFNLAMDAGEVTEKTPEQAFMYVDYVRIWRRKDAAE